MNVLSIIVFTFYLLATILYWTFFLTAITENPNYSYLIIGATPYIINVHLQLLLFVWRLQTLNDVKLSSGILAYSNKIIYLLYGAIGLSCIFVVLPFVVSVLFAPLFFITFIATYSVLISLYLKQIVKLLHYKVNNNSNITTMKPIERAASRSISGDNNNDDNTINTGSNADDASDRNTNTNSRVSDSTGGEIARLSIDLSIQYCVSLLIGFVTTTIIFIMFTITSATLEQPDDSFEEKTYIPLNDMWIAMDCSINACVIYCLYPFSRNFYNKICCFADRFCRKYVLLRMAQKVTLGDNNVTNETDAKNAQQLKNLLLSSSYGSMEVEMGQT